MINLGKTAKWVTRRSKFISNLSNVRDKLKVWIRLTIGKMCPGIGMTARETDRDREREVKNLCATD